MNILLIEDNQQIAQNIVQYLALEHITVDHSGDGREWLSLALQGHYDLILLDVMLPGLDGIQVAQHIRAQREVPILMITAKGQLEDKLQWFDSWADDYLVKPFDLEEMLVRIKAILRRKNQFDRFVFKDIEVYLPSRKVTKQGEEINLTIKEFYVLEMLLKNYGLAVSRADIIEYVWWGEAVWEETDKLDVYIANLRKKLDKDLIQTIKWYGYKIEKAE